MDTKEISQVSRGCVRQGEAPRQFRLGECLDARDAATCEPMHGETYGPGNDPRYN